MRKILVCGSAGFLMSNLMRYMLYRAKDYEFSSIDPLRNEGDQRNVYLHKRHSFHVGDAGDPDFLDRVARLENPDIVVLGTGTHRPVCSNGASIEDIVLPTAAVCDLSRIRGFQVVRLAPDPNVPDMGIRPMWEYVEAMVLGVGGTILRLPECFGRRGNGEFERALETILLGKATPDWRPETRRRRYAYAEDVASMLWFLIDEDVRGMVDMPALGYASPEDMVVMAYPLLGWGEPPEGMGTSMLGCMPEGMPSPILKWIPDSKDMFDSIIKTVKWYTINKWVFNT